MIILHTFENNFDDDHNYHQFIQRGDSVMDAEGLGEKQTLRQFLEGLHGELCLEDDPLPEDYWDEEIDGPRPAYNADLEALIEAGHIQTFLRRAEEIAMVNTGGSPEHVCQTRFGEWTFDSVVIEPPSLREQQDDVWAEHHAFPKCDWKYEVANDNITSGYWEWAEHQIEQNS